MGQGQSGSRGSRVRFQQHGCDARQPFGNSTLREDPSRTVPFTELAQQLLGNPHTSPINRVYAPSSDSFYTGRPDLYRWNVKYDGQGSVNDFLQRIEELRVSRGVSKTQLLFPAAELFTGDALLWWRTQSFNDWDELVLRIKEFFQPYNYEYSLWDEIIIT